MLNITSLQHRASPRVAILIPAFKNAITVRKTIESILSQDAINVVSWIEVCEDASGDDTFLAATEACHGSKAIRIHRNDINLGEAGNIMSAISRMPPSIEWIFFLHADDYAYPDWVSTTLEAILAAPPEVAVIGSSYDVISTDGAIIASGEGRGEALMHRTFVGPDNISGVFLNGCWWHISGGAVKRSVWLQLSGRDKAMPLAGDADFLVRVFKEGYGITYIPRPLTAYRLSATSVSSQVYNKLADVLEYASLADRYHLHLTAKQLLGFEVKLLGRCARFIAKQSLKRDRRLFTKGCAAGLQLLGHQQRLLRQRLFVRR